MVSKQIVDFDKELGLLLHGDEPVPTKEIKLLGRSWTIQCDLNSFAMAQIAGGDATHLAHFVSNLVVEDQREDFVTALSAAKGLTGERLGALLSKLIEVAGERPTNVPSPSPATAKRRTSTLRSVGS